MKINSLEEESTAEVPKTGFWATGQGSILLRKAVGVCEVYFEHVEFKVSTEYPEKILTGHWKCEFAT